MKLGDLRSHGSTKLGVQIGQRLIQKEHSRVADHCTSKRHPLALTA